jgi:hypothetical protein
MRADFIRSNIIDKPTKIGEGYRNKEPILLDKLSITKDSSLVKGIVKEYEAKVYIPVGRHKNDCRYYEFNPIIRSNASIETIIKKHLPAYAKTISQKSKKYIEKECLGDPASINKYWKGKFYKAMPCMEKVVDFLADKTIIIDKLFNKLRKEKDLVYIVKSKGKVCNVSGSLYGRVELSGNHMTRMNKVISSLNIKDPSVLKYYDDTVEELREKAQYLKAKIQPKMNMAEAFGNELVKDELTRTLIDIATYNTTLNRYRGENLREEVVKLSVLERRYKEEVANREKIKEEIKKIEEKLRTINLEEVKEDLKKIEEGL